MTKPSNEIKMIFEDIMTGKKQIEEFSKDEISAIIQAIIHYLDINAIIIATRKGNYQCISDNLPPKK